MKRSRTLLAVAGLALIIWSAGCAHRTTPVIGLPPELQDIAALAQNHTSEENIIGYIRNSGQAYRLTANDIVLLSQNGVSQNVIAALMQQPPVTPTTPAVVAAESVAPATPAAPATVINVNNPPAPPTAPTVMVAPSPVTVLAPMPAEPPANPEYFEAQLAPYGQWMYLPEFGSRCWVPAGLPPGWRPYFDNGYWLYTDSGMYWQSDHPWGAIPFHYGRWVYRGTWLWVPAYEYAPSWVIWRHTEGYMGWAPVPPGALFVGGGWEFRGRRVAVDFDFGLSPTLFVFVGGGHFLNRDFHRHELRGDDWHRVYGRSQINRFQRDERSRTFRVEGLERDRVEHLVGHKVEPVRHDEVRTHALENLRQPKPVTGPKTNPPAASGEPKMRPHADPVTPAAVAPKVTPVQPVEVRPRNVQPQALTARPVAEPVSKIAPVPPTANATPGLRQPSELRTPADVTPAPVPSPEVRPRNIQPRKTTPQPSADTTPKVTPVQPVEPQAREINPKRIAPQPSAPAVMPESRPDTAPASVTHKLTPVPPAEARPHEAQSKRTASQPQADTPPNVKSSQPAELRELPVQPRSEPVAHTPVREERSGRTSGKPTTVDAPTAQDSTGRTAPADSRRKRKDSDQQLPDQN